MSAICGFWKVGSSKDVNPQEIKGMIDCLNHWEADTTGSWQDNCISLGHLMLHNTPESLKEQLPFYDADSGLAITADARIDYREELLEKLGLSSGEYPTDSILILRAYQKWGQDCVKHLYGAFAFAIYDKRSNQIFCARDQVGVKSLFYYYKDGLFAFSSEIKGILALEETDRSIDQQYIPDYLAKIFPDTTGTLYEHILRLEPAHSMLMSPNGLEKSQYWSLDMAAKRNWESKEEAIKALRTHLSRAVKERLRSAYPIGSELSSGLDSSGVTTLAQKHLTETGSEVYSYSNVMDDKDKETTIPFEDESEGIQRVVEKAKISNARMVTGLDFPVDQLIDYNAAFLDQPPKTFGAFYSDGVFRAAKADNVRTLLTGTGGDEIASIDITGLKSHYRKENNIISRWNEIMRVSRKAKQSPASAILRYLLRETKFFSWLLRVVRGEKKTPMGAFRLPGIQPDIIENFQLVERIKKTKGAKYPRSIQEFQKDVLHRPKYCEGMLIEELITRRHKIEYRYPLLDIPLLELAYTFPEKWLAYDQIPRYMFRKAMEDYIPDNVLWNTKKLRVFNVASVFQRITKSRADLTSELVQLEKKQGLNKYVVMPYPREIMKKFDPALKEYNTAQVNYAIQVLILSKIVDFSDSSAIGL